MPIRDLPSFLSKLGHDRTAKDVKGAYVSWHKDFKDVIRILRDGKISEKDRVGFFGRIRRFSKLLYRILKALYDFAFAFYFFEEVISYSIFAAGLITTNPIGIIVAPVLVFAPFVADRLFKGLLNVIEGLLRRRKTNLKEFDQLAFGKQASPYLYTARLARQLEQYC